jgi:TPR repeat protein
VDGELERTPEIVRKVLRGRHADAVQDDPSVPPIGDPYWGANGLISTVGLMGVEARRRVAMDPATDPSLLALMADDPDADVRALVARHPNAEAARQGQPRAGDRAREDIDQWIALALDAEESGDVEQARRLYTRAADVGDTASMLSLGILHHEQGDTERSIAWFKRAADAGEREGLSDIGRVYFRQGDVAQAIKWFVQGAEAGDTGAMIQLGRLYTRENKPSEARKWYIRAADAGHSDAMAEVTSLPKSQKSGCYIASAVYGSHEAAPVRVLRRYRDDSLATSMIGRGFIRAYYAVSPRMAKHFEQSSVLNRATRRVLDFVVRRLDDVR